VLFFLILAATVGSLCAEDLTVRDGSVGPAQILPGESVAARFTIGGGGKKVYATVFARAGSLDTPPAKWHEGAARFEPMYPIRALDLLDRTKVVECVLPSHATERLASGVFSVFVAVSGAGPGWRYTKLGEFAVVTNDRIALPERSGPPRVAIWEEPRAGAPLIPLERLAQVVRGAGAEPVRVSSAEMAALSTFGRTQFDLLILPYAGAYSSKSLRSVAQFLQDAGALLCLGGIPLTRSLDVGADRVPKVVLDAADEAGFAELGVEKGPASVGTLLRAASDGESKGSAAHLQVTDLSDWMYLAIPLEDTGDAPYIRFRPRGGPETDRLCLEAVGVDKSRWKYFVSLGEFAAYASPERGGLGDSLDPAEVVLLKMGFYRALFDDAKPRNLWVNDIRRLSTHPHPVAARAAHVARWRAQYEYLKCRPVIDALGLVVDARRIDAVRGFEAAAHPLFHGLGTMSPGRGFWDLSVRRRQLVAENRGATPTVVARTISVVQGEDDDGRPLGCAASLTFHHRGELRGSTCAFVGIDGPWDGQFDSLVERLVRCLTVPMFVHSPRPVFDAVDGELRQTWQLNIANWSRDTRDMTVRISDVTGTITTVTHVDVGAGETAQASIALDAGDVDLRHFGVRVDLQSDGRPVDFLVAEADALDALRQAGEWLLQHQRPEGNYSTWFYADVYGARALRVLAELTGDRRYLDSALRLTDMLVREQRADGGWWVGYGPNRDCVFVADDGCIALGLVQMVPYLDAERREAYLRAARRHVAFRESFRITEQVAEQIRAEYGPKAEGILPGGLGIGFVRNNYFGDGRFDVQHREMRQRVWTMHCSLAFLGGLVSLTGDDEVKHILHRDARWFLDRIAEGSDSPYSPYASEATLWLVETVDEPELRASLEAALREKLVERLADSKDLWWMDSECRGALRLPAFVRGSRTLDSVPDTRRALARALWSICGSHSQLSLYVTAGNRERSRRCADTMYMCFSALGLAELLSPGSTMLPEDQHGRGARRPR
jgi:hypothetical protein